MTLAALICTAMFAPPRVVELPEAGPTVVVQAFVPAPDNMGDREQAAWAVLADALYDGTSEFSRDKLREFGSQAGVPLLIESCPDFIKIQVVEPKGGLNVGCQILESLVLRASLTGSAIEESRNRLKMRRSGPWEQAMLDFDLPFDKVTPEAVKNVYVQSFRPDKMTFAFAGDLGSGDGQAQISERFQGKQPNPPMRIRFDRSPRTWSKHFDPVSTFEWRGKPLSISKDDDVATILAVIALGVGKESGMHRVLREGLGWTYRQEAVFWPSTKGWIPRLIFARSAEASSPEQLAQAQEALKKDVETWDEKTLQRAQAMLSTSLQGRNPLCPFWTSLHGTFEGSLIDRCTWIGLSVMMSGAAVDTQNLVSKSSEVKPDELKAAANRLLDEAQASVIPGR